MANKESTEIILDQVRSILRHYDVAGAVIIIDKNRTTYAVEVGPTWSGLSIEAEDAVRLKLSKDDVDKASWTGHIVYSIRDIASHWAKGFSQIAQLIEANAKVEHKPFFMQ